MAFAGVSFVGNGRSSAVTRSASDTTITITDSGYHLLIVDGYSRTKQDYPNGKCFVSRPFRVAGYRWVIEYYPNGRIGHDAGCVSLFLSMYDDDSVTETVKVQFGFSFVGKVQKEPSEIRARKVHGFNNQTSCGYHRFMKIEDLEKSTHLKDDCLTIKCDIMVTKDVNTSASTAPFVVVPESDMQQHFTSPLQSGQGTDVTFEVGSEIFAAHRCILASRSTVFKAEFLGSLEEERSMASVTHTRIDNMEARVLKLLLGFIYSDSVPEMEEEDDVTWQHLLVVADGYDLPRLRLICEQRLCAYINTSSAATVLALAELHHCQGLKEACLDFLKVHENLQEVMVLGGLDHLTSSCPSVFKELIARLVSPNTEAASDDTAALPFVVVPASDMHWHFTGLLKSAEGTDVTFEVSGETIPAHRCVLTARSPVFRAQLFGPMKEGTTTGVIRIDDMEAKVFKLLLIFIYSDLMPDIEGNDCEDSNVDDAEVMWQHLLVAADRYDIQRLRLMCEEKLCGYIRISMVATILELAELHHCGGLKEACLDFLDFPANLQEVMDAGGLNHLRSSCPSVLIDLIAKLVSLKLDN